ncbi:peroxisomal biogenesis factor 19 [Trichogramma pretiosum]|uniref:peroxisomal biogenesis factor 19 n=1 Tax=Trichogramma pretiosum TaxID=7493 RepID=UPI0006C96343|nr:peroxisomal biogenesis factor 19 [Trichogramma pretiosum]
MSDDNKKETDPKLDDELSELLDSALKDFDKPVVPAAAATNKDENPSADAADGEIEVIQASGEMDELWTQDFMKQAAEQFQKNLEELMKNEAGTELGESFKKMAETVAGAISTDTSEAENITADFQSAIAQAMKDLSAQSETLSAGVPNITDADLAAMFGQASFENAGEDMLPFMQGMMQSLLSKDVLYPSMKDLIDKYPAWLDENREKLSPEELARYEKQLMLMQKVCQELETEKEDDSEEIKKKRFETTLSLMQEMQTCGQPPQDLINEQPAIFPLDVDPSAATPENMAGLTEGQNCSVM